MARLLKACCTLLIVKSFLIFLLMNSFNSVLCVRITGVLTLAQWHYLFENWNSCTLLAMARLLNACCTLLIVKSFLIFLLMNSFNSVLCVRITGVLTLAQWHYLFENWNSCTLLAMARLLKACCTLLIVKSFLIFLLMNSFNSVLCVRITNLVGYTKWICCQIFKLIFPHRKPSYGRLHPVTKQKKNFNCVIWNHLETPREMLREKWNWLLKNLTKEHMSQYISHRLQNYYRIITVI